MTAQKQSRLKELAADFDNIESRRLLVEEFADSEFPFSGINEEGEETLMSISASGIMVDTYQSNGWVRKNHYDANGYAEGETFDGRWNG